MAVTITTDDVKDIICVSDSIPAAKLDALVDTAKCLVDSLPDIELECGIDKANEVAKYLAAHLFTFVDPRQMEQSTLEASEKFESNTGIGLNNSKYGQTAKLLDCTGGLEKRDASPEAEGARPIHIFKVDGR